MSQQLIPSNGGITPEVQTAIFSPQVSLLSKQYVALKGLQSRETEWNAQGRPVYNRLPAISETYRIDFYNLVADSNVIGNTFAKESIEEVGYVYVPYGESINGGKSMEVTASESKGDIIIKAGSIIWKYGKNDTIPTLINLSLLEVLSGRYELAYELVYDNSPKPFLYEAEDFSLAGQPLTITSSSDAVIGWRRNAVNAFISESDLFWSNEDSLFPSYAQPAGAFLSWGSELSHAYSKIVLRCPTGTQYSGTATLTYSGDVNISPIEVPVSSDRQGQFFQFDLEPVLVNGWRVDFSSNKVSIQSIQVTGTLTLLNNQYAYSPRSQLVMYPYGTLPKEVINVSGEKVPATYCRLAIVDVDDNFKVTRVEDQRSIIQRDYSPIADWLTKPVDEDLIDMYQQVSNYSKLWMSPENCLKHEYHDLKDLQITVED